MTRQIAAISIALALLTSAASAKYKPVTPRTKLQPGQVAVTEPGSYAKAGTTYVLTKDISSARSPIFLGKDVTLDLNGHSITYAAGDYVHVPNWSFEDGLKGWDVSKAAGAKVEDRHMVNPLVGKNVCILPEGREIVSGYINLPVANRAYYAMVAVASHRSRVGVYVEDENGKTVECAFKFADKTRPCCPEPRRSPKLGGGVVFALMFGQPAGRYRIRVKAVEGTCVIDAVDIRPAMDVGVSIVEKTYPWAYYKCILDGDGCAFFDYTEKGSTSVPVKSVPRVTGAGTVTIRNGVIRSGFDGIRSWGVQSTAGKVRVVLDNVKVQAAGINTNAVSIETGEIRNGRFEIDTPWIIDRHRRGDVAVAFNGPGGTNHVLDSEFIGGQGCLTFRGKGGLVKGNLFVNNQSVTNHYSLSLDSNGGEVCNNIFRPKRGAGIYIYKYRDNDVHHNEFEIVASPPINEYSRTDYSVSAVRLSDYNAAQGSKASCAGNRVHHNRIRIVGRDFEGADPKYKPMAYGFFVSVGGGANYIYENDIVVEHRNPGSKAAAAYAFYIGGSNEGGVIYNNRITTNVTPFWISTRYGPAKNVLIYGNTITAAKGAGKFAPFRFGYWKHPCKAVGLYSNRFIGTGFDAFINDYTSGYVSEYAFGWTLTVKGKPGAEVVVASADGAEAARGKIGKDGVFVARLAEFTAVGKKRTDRSTYTIKVGDSKKTVKMTADQNVTMP